MRKQFKRPAWQYILLLGSLTSTLALALFIDAAQAQSESDKQYRLNIDVYSGIVPAGESNSEALLIQLAALEKGTGVAPAQLGNVVHIDHAADNAFDVAGVGETNGYKVAVRGRVIKQPDGRLKISFSELGVAPASSGAPELLLAPGERRLWRLPDIATTASATLETVVLVSAPTK